MGRMWLGLTGALAFATAPTAASAQTCDTLRAQLAGATGELLGIAVDYPKTHIAIVTCMVNNETDEERGACAAAMVLGACIGLGYDGCNDLASRWQRVQRIYQNVAARMRAEGCRR